MNELPRQMLNRMTLVPFLLVALLALLRLFDPPERSAA